MKLFLGVFICGLALLLPVAVLAGGGGGGFDGVVNSIESRYHTQATRIPFLGVLTFMSGAASQNGVRGLHVAEFENFRGPANGEELNQMVTQQLGKDWTRIVRETSRHGNEQTLIYMRPEGRRMGLFVVDLDGDELDVVQTSVDADHVSENLGHYEHPHHGSDRD